MSKREKLESTIESLEVALKGWESHPNCDQRTKMIE